MEQCSDARFKTDFAGFGRAATNRSFDARRSGSGNYGYGKEVAFRIEWLGWNAKRCRSTASFCWRLCGATSVKIETNVPAPQMGETNKTVQISYWRADWQAIVDGRADEITSIYPNSKPTIIRLTRNLWKIIRKAQQETTLRLFSGESNGQ